MEKINKEKMINCRQDRYNKDSFYKNKNIDQIFHFHIVDIHKNKNICFIYEMEWYFQGKK